MKRIANAGFWILMVAFPATAAMRGFAAEALSTRLDQKLPSFDSSEGNQIFILCQKLSVPCGVEELREDSITDSTGPAITHKAATPRDVLDGIKGRHQSYSWDDRDGMIHLRYAGQKSSPLDNRIEHLVIMNELSFRAVQDVLKQAGIKAGFSLVGDPRFGRVTLDLKNVTAREALDMIAKADGKIAWYFRFSAAEKRNDFGVYSWRTSDGESPFPWRQKKSSK